MTNEIKTTTITKVKFKLILSGNGLVLETQPEHMSWIRAQSLARNLSRADGVAKCEMTTPNTRIEYVDGIFEGGEDL